MMTSGGDWREITKDLRLVLRWIAQGFRGVDGVSSNLERELERKWLRITGVTLRG